MHSLRSLVLVPALLVAGACSKGDDQAASSSPLDRDLTLSAQLKGTDTPASAGAELVASGACRSEHAPAAPTAAKRGEALALEQRAAEAEFAGNIAVARDLHRQAARLDGTSEAIAYRLARADEASGDRAAAVAGYCHYLTLAPTATNAKEGRTRLNALVGSASATQLAQATTPAPRAPRRTAVTTAATVQRAAGRRSSTSASVATVAAAPSVDPTPARVGEADAVSGASQATNGAENVAVASTGEVSAQQEPAVTTTPSVPATVRRPADHTARDAAIGAAAGAAVGAMTSRSVKGAMIGGVAGGILGAVVGRTTGGSGFRTPGFGH